MDSVRRYDQREKTYTDVPQPSIVKVYNTYIGGIDMCWTCCVHFIKAK